jgi:aryl-alcohol dehydrogenase-like predicted oxidoreductase
MDHRTLGRTGILVSPLVLGSMNFGNPTDADTSVRMIGMALDAGINMIDTANVYGGGESERIVGEGLRQLGRRDDVVLATKMGFPVGPGPLDRGHSRLNIIKSCEDSLRRLQTDHIDLYQLHRPSMDVPQDETLRAFDDLVGAGKVRHIGCSTHPAWMVAEAQGIVERLHLTPYVSEQPPYNLLDRRIENELIPVCQRNGMAIFPWGPLASGILAGRYSRVDDRPDGSRAARGAPTQAARITERSLAVTEAVARMAAERGLTQSQLALLWVKDQPGITAPILGPRTPEQLEDALVVLEMSLAEDDRPLFDDLVPPGNAVSDFHNTARMWMKGTVG